jgi:hypothetical protein
MYCKIDEAEFLLGKSKIGRHANSKKLSFCEMKMFNLSDDLSLLEQSDSLSQPFAYISGSFVPDGGESVVVCVHDIDCNIETNVGFIPQKMETLGFPLQNPSSSSECFKIPTRFTCLKHLVVRGGLLQLLTYHFINSIIEETSEIFSKVVKNDLYNSSKNPIILNAEVLLESIVNAIAHADYSWWKKSHGYKRNCIEVNESGSLRSSVSSHNKLEELNYCCSFPFIEIHIYPTQVVIVNPFVPINGYEYSYNLQSASIPGTLSLSTMFADRNLLIPLSYNHNPILSSFFVKCGLMSPLGGLGRAQKAYTVLLLLLL